MNIVIAKKIIKQLIKSGLRTFCLCPGARPAPFIELLSSYRELRLFYFYDERSASFFALGRAKQEDRPVAVITSSGTAVAELLPALIEAYYSAIPLVLVTADRPLKFGKNQAPQTLLSAVRILSEYCYYSKNISQIEDVRLSFWKPELGSIHLNVCFDEPLLDQKLSPASLSLHKTLSNKSYIKKQVPFSLQNAQVKMACNLKRNKQFKSKCDQDLNIFFKRCKKPLVLIGALNPKEIQAVKSLLTNYKGLVYAEPLACLEARIPQLVSGEYILPYAFKHQYIDGVIRLGGIPRVRFWRDLEKNTLPVLNLASPPFYSGLSRKSFNQVLLASISRLKPYLLDLKHDFSKLKDQDLQQAQKIKTLMSQHAQSEDHWFLILKQQIAKNSNIFLGNSSPIRLWDRTSFYQKNHAYIRGQSGVNGIDGLLSRFLGGCDLQKHNIGILGDLSLLYDMSGFWNSNKLPKWTLIVINNQAGQIFSRMFKNPAFLNKHNLTFASLAKFWGVNYSLCTNTTKFYWPKSAHNLIEIQPRDQDTKNYFKAYMSLWDI